MNTKRTKTQADIIAHRIKSMGFHPYVREFGNNPVYSRLYVSAESDHNAADYYGAYRGCSPWINPKLEQLAEQYNCYWKWENRCTLVLVDC